MAKAGRQAGLRDAAPFWAALLLLPLGLWSALAGGLAVFAVPVAAWYVTSIVDALIGRDKAGLDPHMDPSGLRLYDLVLYAWMPLQAVFLLLVIAIATRSDHLALWEMIAIFFGVGAITGTIGITYAHELMHRPGRLARWLSESLLAMTLYGHFRSEHLRVHHTHVGTPRDTATARPGEGFHRYFFRVLPGGLASAWRAETERLAQKGLPWWDRANPFWRYAGLQLIAVLCATLAGGFAGLALFAFQALVAVWQLELTNYVEHYGLTRRRMPSGRYEPAGAHHSWDASEAASNRLLINLQRHADHHIHPARPFPLLQHLGRLATPQLPFSYPLMTGAALVPPLWRRIMDPRLNRWRAMHYPEVTDWEREMAFWRGDAADTRPNAATGHRQPERHPV